MKTRSSNHPQASRNPVQKSFMKFKRRLSRRLARRQMPTQACPICYDSLDQSELMFPLSCGHSFHIECINTHFSVSLDNSAVPFTCPKHDCRAELSTEDTSLRLSEGDRERLEKLSFLKFLATHPNFKQCPAPNCELVFEVSSSPSNFTCPSCGSVYCSRCLEVHGDLTCLEHQYYEHLDASTEGEILQTARQAKYKKCPRCRFWVEKSDGCDHMRCRCEFEFCYKCGGVYNRCACNGYNNEAELASVVQF